MIAKIFSSKKRSLVLALEEIKNKVDDSIGGYDFILFSIHPDYNYEDVNYLVRKIFKTEHYAGFHAISSMENDNVVDGLVMCFLKFEREGKASLFVMEDIRESDALRRTADYLNQNRENLNIIIGGLCDHRLSFFIEDLANFIDYKPINNVVGGLSSGDGKENGEILTYQFVADQVIKNGFFILTLENVEYDLRIALGFKPYGITYEMDKVEDYKLYTIDYTVDGVSRFSNVIKSFLKKMESEDVKHLWYCPIMIIDDEEGYVATMRTFKDVSDEYVEFYGPIKHGQRFKLSFATEEELLGESKRIAQEAKKVMKHPDLIFDFSCAARQYVLGELQNKEPDIYVSILDAPLFGFFTYGEIGPDKFYKKLKFYNETSVLLSLRER